MKKNKLVVCQSFKYRDFMFKNYTGECIKAGKVYKVLVDDDGAHYLSIMLDKVEHLIFLSALDIDLKDPRFTGRFTELNLDYIVNRGLPIMDDVQDLEDWIDGKYDEELEEEEISEEEAFEDIEKQDLVVDIYSKLQIFTPKLSTGVLEALAGVESILPGDLMDEEKERLIEALNGCILNYLNSSNKNELFMAQYLLFNIINLAKNKW